MIALPKGLFILFVLGSDSEWINEAIYLWMKNKDE